MLALAPSALEPAPAKTLWTWLTALATMPPWPISGCPSSFSAGLFTALSRVLAALASADA
ncbi:hypothetical protein OSJ79_13075 [Mycobacterium ulcerans]